MNEDYSSKSVTIIVDPNFGIALKECVGAHPVWVRRSAANSPVAEALWAQGTLSNSSLTIFYPAEGASEEPAFLNVLDTVDQHHPYWSHMRVMGVSPTQLIADCLGDYGEGELVSSSDGFTYHRN
jgi:hypothetical protein